MTTAILDARQTVAAPSRTARRFGLFSAVEVVTGGDTHWLYGGLTADGEECSKPLSGTIACGPSPNKTARSWYSDIEGDPWLAYMYETCKTVGRFQQSAAKLRTRFLAAEQSAAEAGLVSNLLTTAPAVTPAVATLTGAVAALERDAAQEYGGQITLYVPAEAVADSPAYFVRVGDHLETLSGNVVTVGNYGDGGQVWGSGALTLYRTELIETGPAVNTATNDYYVLIERGYAALVDCWLAQADVGGP